MSHIMLDLETLGKSAGCIILSIGAVVFSPKHGLGAQFDRIVSTKSCVAAGLISEPETVAWWERQEPKAKQLLIQARSDAAWGLREVLADFTKFIAANGGIVDARIWGNGADFDNVILAHAYKAERIPAPWRYYHNRCYRTVKASAPSIDAGPRKGVHHSAIDDARYQAEHLIAIMKSWSTAATAERVKNDAVEQGGLDL